MVVKLKHNLDLKHYLLVSKAVKKVILLEFNVNFHIQSDIYI